MMNNLLARFDSDNLRKTLKYLIISILLIVGSIFFGFTKGSSLWVLAFLVGCILFFYAALHPWEKPFYYFIMLVISIILMILLFKFGIGILVKLQSNYQIPGRWAENMAWAIGEVFLAAFIAGITGMLMFRKAD